MKRMSLGELSFWKFYILACLIAGLSMVYFWLSSTVIWESIYGEPLQPPGIAGIGMLIAEWTERLSLPADSVLATLAMSIDHWFLFPCYLFPAAPSLAAIIMVAWFWKWAGVRALFSRLKPWLGEVGRAEGLRIYGLVFAGIIVFAAISLVLQGVVADGGTEAAWQGLRLDTPVTALFVLVLGFLTTHGGLLEELGWHGFAWPMLQERMRSPLHAALFLGILWAAWHLPREFAQLAAGAPVGQIAVQQLAFFVTCMALMVIISYAVNRTGGSVLPAIIIHGANNYLGGAMGDNRVFLAFSVNGLMEVAIAIVIVIIAGAELGRRPERRPDLEKTTAESGGSQ
jgi:hypothetical protein